MLKRSNLNLTRKYLNHLDIDTTLRLAKAVAVYTVLESDNPSKLEELEREARLRNVFSFIDVRGTVINNL